MKKGITPEQLKAYWKIYASVCRVQGWKTSDKAQRLKFHIEVVVPASTKDWDRKADYDKFLHYAELLQNRVDIVDRERVRVEHTIEHLAAAIAEIETVNGREVTGDGYIRGIVRDMNDRESWRDLPLDPREAQIKSGAATFNPKKNRGRGGYDNLAGDLANLRDTLKNRLSKLLTAIKTGAACPAGKDWYLVCANNNVIGAIQSGKVCLPAGRGRYAYCTPEEYAAQERRAAAARAIVPEPHRAKTPPAPREGKGRKIRTNFLGPAEPLPGHEHDEDYVPF